MGQNPPSIERLDENNKYCKQSRFLLGGLEYIPIQTVLKVVDVVYEVHHMGDMSGTWCSTHHWL